jgi:hypothetical protein
MIDNYVLCGERIYRRGVRASINTVSGGGARAGEYGANVNMCHITASQT